MDPRAPKSRDRSPDTAAVARGPRPALAVSNRWRTFEEIPSPPRADCWLPFTWDNKGTPQHGIWLTSEVAAWHELFAALDELGQGLPDGSVPVEDEADAIIACCWRYGSYFDLLTAGELYPPFRTDENLSRVCDYEMKRINLEFSSGVAAWLDDRERSPSKLHRRARAAIAYLPMPWRDLREDRWIEAVQLSSARRARKLESINAPHLARDHASASNVDYEHHLRQEANYMVSVCFRNGPIENFHAGRWCHGRDVPGFLRFYPREVTKLADDVAANMAICLMERDSLDPQLLRVIHAMGSPHNWSLTKESSPIRFDGMPGAEPLDDRVGHLAQRFPTRFGDDFDGIVPTADQRLHNET